MRKIDGSGPPPMWEHERKEWRARRTGVPPYTTTYVCGRCWNRPTSHEDQKGQLEDYQESARALKRK